MEKNTLLIRTDASTLIGTGHVMRCLALAQAWQDKGGTVTFLMAPGSPPLEQRICSGGMNVQAIEEQPGSNDDAIITAEIANKIESSWVVVDGYQFSANYQKILKEHNCRIFFIDDFGHADHYYADIILNQNIYADMSYYKQKYEPYSRFLIGTKYVLIRKEFLKFSGWNRKIPKIAHKVLVTLGGGDPHNVTLIVIESLKKVRVDDLEVIVVVGGANPHHLELNKAIRNFPKCKIIKNGADMPTLMAWADIAISAGGSTCWELVFLGVPGIIITLADNQQLIAKHLNQEISYVTLGWYNDISDEKLTDAIHSLIFNPEKRLEISQKAQKIVDGEGAIRVVQKIIDAEDRT
jgi:UDP-2,4-diacetamido-2,4,6-trideoxy-beta-L-altropyranose hydrolase